ncbi:hypothetical protein DY000_02014217 [Brassica cretica]|uniref:Transmembrane protein n=1 Tax=Brassica cretica TaxID=69181 RepID=A0ABQ7DB81_BRACR|nr:hypothetical protein DY000_02014217 [Brassica cretica]
MVLIFQSFKGRFVNFRFFISGFGYAGFNQMVLIFHLDMYFVCSIKVLIRWFSSSTWICFTNLGLIYMFFRSGSYFGRHMGSLLGSLLKYNAEVFQTTSRRLPGSLPDDFKEVF